MTEWPKYFSYSTPTGQYGVVLHNDEDADIAIRKMFNQLGEDHPYSIDAVASLPTRTVEIDLGMVVTVEVPEFMSDWEACGEIDRVVGGAGDPRRGVNMLASIGFSAMSQIKANLANITSPVRTTGSVKTIIKVSGDNRTPRQRAIEEERNAKA
jgi:hypothetical protein